MDHAAFLELVARTEAPVRSYLAGIGVPVMDIDDLAQEAYLAHFRQAGAMPADADELGWLKGIARNMALRFFRTRARQGKPLGEVVELLEGATVTWSGGEDAQLDALRRCLSALDERTRAMFSAYYAEGGSSAAVGARFASTPEAVRILMLRMRERLRLCIERRLVAEGGA